MDSLPCLRKKGSIFYALLAHVVAAPLMLMLIYKQNNSNRKKNGAVLCLIASLGSSPDEL